MQWWQAMLIGALASLASGPTVDRFIAWIRHRR
jgi:hypothetical protein